MTSLIDALKETDPVAEIQFCNWFLQSVYGGSVDRDLVFFPNKACFALCGEVNFRNSRYWSAENLGRFHKHSLHDETEDTVSALW
jgi:hypothetical protein